MHPTSSSLSRLEPVSLLAQLDPMEALSLVNAQLATHHVFNVTDPQTLTAQFVLKPICSPEPLATQDALMVATLEEESATHATFNAANAHHHLFAKHVLVDTF